MHFVQQADLLNLPKQRLSLWRTFLRQTTNAPKSNNKKRNVKEEIGVGGQGGRNLGSEGLGSSNIWVPILIYSSEILYEGSICNRCLDSTQRPPPNLSYIWWDLIILLASDILPQSEKLHWPQHWLKTKATRAIMSNFTGYMNSTDSLKLLLEILDYSLLPEAMSERASSTASKTSYD